uniref:Gamma-interferon-inducible lysosomal thiol reductase n=1 Tax=Lygus hesperus TaxID=30085 RepID=A0A0A9XVG7_LYGHE
MIPTTFTFLLFAACAFAADNSTKVNVTVYYESLCPDSAKFITTQLVPTWEKMMDNIDLVLVPYGKSTSEKTENGTKINCHHGEEECVGNRIQSCILEGSAIPNMTAQVKIIDCLMKEAKKEQPYPTKSCVTKVGGLDVEKVTMALESCANSTRGEELLMKNGEKTKAFEDPLANVPAVTMNGMKDKDAIADFHAAMCKASANKIESCNKKNSSPALVASLVLPLVASVFLVKL